MDYYKALEKNIQDISNLMGWGNYYEQLGLPDHGLCYGLCMMMAKAVLCNDTVTFFRRMNVLTRTYKDYPDSDNLIAQIKEHEQWFRSDMRLHNVGLWDRPIDKTSPEIWDIRGFLDGLLLYHKPQSTSLKTFFIHQTYQASKYVFPTDNGQSNMARLWHHLIVGHTPLCIGIIIRLFFQLKNWLGDHPVAVTLTSYRHIVVLAVLNDKLTLYDANLMVDDNFTIEFNDPTKLSNAIQKAFEFDYDKNKICLSLSVYCLQKHFDSNFSKMNPYSCIDNINDLTSKKVFGLAYRLGHVDEVKDFIQKKLGDFGRFGYILRDQTEFSALHIASNFDQVQVVCLLLLGGANPETICDGKTPKQLAASKGLQLVVKTFEDWEFAHHTRREEEARSQFIKYIKPLFAGREYLLDGL